MLSSFPGLGPRDSYALWYTPAHQPQPVPQQQQQDQGGNTSDHVLGNVAHGHNGFQRRQASISSYRSPLARLRADEQYMERRKINVQNYGNSWIKPPGIPKSLHQLREEQREMEEHQEAMRREALAQELAEAEGADELLQGEAVEGGDMDEARDLDDDIPEAETTGLDAEDSDIDEDTGLHDDGAPRVIAPPQLPEDVYREALVRGRGIPNRRIPADRSSVSDEEDRSQILQEEDLLHDSHSHAQSEVGVDMDADLDAEIPEAETGGYEHTDTEAELSSSEEDDDDDDNDNDEEDDDNDDDDNDDNGDVSGPRGSQLRQ